MLVNISIPQTWDSLTIKQFKNIVYQLECFQTIIKDTPVAKTYATTKLYLQICKELLSSNSWKAKRWALQEIQPKEFQPHTDFIYKTIARTKFLPSVKIQRTTYYAPATRLRNSTIAEFAYIDAAFYNWRQTQNRIWLDVLCAALYRETSTVSTEIDPRKPFVKIEVDARADQFEKLDYQTKLAIAYTYEGCRNHIANTFPLIFPKPLKVEGEEAPAPKNQKYVSFGEIILDKIQGDPSKLAITNNVLLYDFLNIYNQDIKHLRKKP